MTYDAIIIDAMNMAYRSWWNCRTLTTTKGTEIINTGLEFGFIRSLLAYIREYQPAQAYLAWDGVPARSLAINSEYKAGRDKSKQETEQPWAPRLERLRDIITPMVSSCYHPEMEADEIMAIFVKQQEAQEKTTLIISNDSDMFQLVSNHTHVFPADKEQTIVARPGVIDRFGVPPEKVPLYRAISGDRSDNLPGVPRISDEFKIQLVTEAHDIDSLIESFHRAPYLTPRQREKLLEGSELVRKNFQIMNLRDLTGPLPIPTPATGDVGPVLQLCRELELKSLLERKEWRLFQPA